VSERCLKLFVDLRLVEIACLHYILQPEVLGIFKLYVSDDGFDSVSRCKPGTDPHRSRTFNRTNKYQIILKVFF
jgi:hypothetical protein